MKKKRDLTNLVLSIIIVVLVNYIGSFWFGRLDLTAEKRYTLSETTVSSLAKLDDIVYVKVYLEGDFNAGFKRLRNATREMLDEFRAYSGKNIEYEFINPSANPDKSEQNKVFKQLIDRGLQPTRLQENGKDGILEKIIFPAALVTYQGRESAWQLLKTRAGSGAEEQLNNSIESLEYEFMSTLRKLQLAVKPKLAFLQGHEELDSTQMADAAKALREYFDVSWVTINNQIHALDNYKALIIAKPDSAFTDKDCYVVDQFIMRGGKVLWLIDPVNTNTDSLAMLGYTLGLDQHLGIEQALYRYGVRLNNVLVEDIQCGQYLVNNSVPGQPPNYRPVPWFYKPLIVPQEAHPIVKNLDAIKFEYVSTIDTISARGISKTILIESSRYTKLQRTPATIELRSAFVQPKPEQFRKSYQPVAVLLEGPFESYYKNQPLPSILEGNKDFPYKKDGVPNKMIVVADGDVIRNEINFKTGKPMVLGFDKHSNIIYHGNKNFILNCMNYLCDESGLIQLRSRNIKLRLLDKQRAERDRVKWQLLNIGLPVVLMLLFGLAYNYRRKKKYAK